MAFSSLRVEDKQFRTVHPSLNAMKQWNNIAGFRAIHKKFQKFDIGLGVQMCKVCDCNFCFGSA